MVVKRNVKFVPKPIKKSTQKSLLVLTDSILNARQELNEIKRKRAAQKRKHDDVAVQRADMIIDSLKTSIATKTAELEKLRNKNR